MRRDVRALVFDLDDTLIRSYEDLIVPLEREAARRMLAAQRAARGEADGQPEPPHLPSQHRLEELLLAFRRRNPSGLPELLAQQLPSLGRRAWQARDAVFQRPSVSRLTRMPGTRRLLEELRLNYRLFLLTHGEREFQVRKLEKCRLAGFFDAVRIVDSGCGKRQALMDLTRALRLDASEVAVIGNRLDLEIGIGRELGHPTVWMQYGEGCEMTAEATGVCPDHVVDELSQLGPLLGF
ncbi:MAG TPA: HAD family hydrolase [Acidobacteriota bacterium]|nr:HAD family hydrolase [Acidobacteriota bacterium]